MTRWVGAAAFLLMLMACGGKLAPEHADAGAIVPPPAPLDAGADAGSPNACATQPFAGARACVPGVGREKSAIQIEMDSPGCLPCGGQILPCSVDVRGDVVTLSADLAVCLPQDNCSNICVPQKTTCQLPPLGTGTFTIAIAGEGPRTGLAPRQLVVEPTGEVACSLDTTPSSIDPSAYATSCETDADCTLITAGDSCAPCTCPNAAISQKSQARYAGDARAATSQCQGNAGDIACAGCPQVRAFCNTSNVCDIGP